jgi:hypothetical protein
MLTLQMKVHALTVPSTRQTGPCPFGPAGQDVAEIGTLHGLAQKPSCETQVFPVGQLLFDVHRA